LKGKTVQSKIIYNFQLKIFNCQTQNKRENDEMGKIFEKNTSDFENWRMYRTQKLLHHELRKNDFESTPYVAAHCDLFALIELGGSWKRL